MKQYRYLVLVITVLVVVLTIVVTVNTDATKMEPVDRDWNTVLQQTELGVLNLRLEDLPEGANLVSDGPVNKDDPSQPLFEDTLNMPEGSDILYQYESAHSFLAFVPTKAVIVASYTYRYRDQSSANEAAKVMISNLQNLPEHSRQLDIKSDLDGQAFTLVGDEGDSVSWFVSTKEDVMSLAMANGFDEKAVNSVLQSAVQDLSVRLAQPLE